MKNSFEISELYYAMFREPLRNKEENSDDQFCSLDTVLYRSYLTLTENAFMKLKTVVIRSKYFNGTKIKEFANYDHFAV